MPKSSDLRGFLKELEEARELAYVEKEVDPAYELPGVMFKTAEANGPALFFKKVKDKEIPVVGNVLASRRRLAMALETSEEETGEAFRERTLNPLPAKFLSQGPCQEVVEDKVDLTKLPIITVHEYDAGPYISCGMVVAKHPESGIPNASLHRILPFGPNRAGIWIRPTCDLADYYNACGDRPLPIAVAIGLHPAYIMAAAAKFPLSVNELEVAGALLREPAELVRCKTVDIEVPAGAEIVLEGKILPEIRELEGPFGEFPGTYGAGAIAPRPAPVIEFKAMTRRKEPIYQAITCGPTPGHEDSHMVCMAREGGVYAAAKAVCSAVRAARVLKPTYIAAIQVDGAIKPGEAGIIMAKAFTVTENLKYVIVVDNDVDISSYSDLFWAIATRVDPGKDIYMFPQMRMNFLDPATNGVCRKVGFDATIPRDADRRGFTRTRIPNLEQIKLQDYLGLA